MEESAPERGFASHGNLALRFVCLWEREERETFVCFICLLNLVTESWVLGGACEHSVDFLGF